MPRPTNHHRESCQPSVTFEWRPGKRSFAWATFWQRVLANIGSVIYEPTADPATGSGAHVEKLSDAGVPMHSDGSF